MRIWSRNLTAGQSLVVSANMGVTMLTLQMSSGSSDEGSFLGDYTLDVPGGTDLASQAIVLGPSEGQTIMAPPNSAIDGLTLACTTGTLRVVGYF